MAEAAGAIEARDAEQTRAAALIAAATWEPRTYAGESEAAALERLMARAERLAAWIEGDDE